MLLNKEAFYLGSITNMSVIDIGTFLHRQSWACIIFYSTLHELRSFTDSSHSFTNASRVDSFVFFSFAKYETIRNRSLFRRVLQSFDCFAKYKIKCFKFFRETKKTLRSFAHFHWNFIPALRFLYLSFDFRTFYSIFVPFI